MVVRNMVASMMERCWNSEVVIINFWKRAQRSGARGLGIISGADGIKPESGRSINGTGPEMMERGTTGTNGLVAVVVWVGADSMMAAGSWWSRRGSTPGVRAAVIGSGSNEIPGGVLGTCLAAGLFLERVIIVAKFPMKTNRSGR
jgi:hypothetical protein